MNSHKFAVLQVTIKQILVEY